MERKFTEQEQIRRDKRDEMIAEGFDPTYSMFKPNAFSLDLAAKYEGAEKADLEENHTELYKVAGRVMAKRGPFVGFQDNQGRGQVYLKSTELAEAEQESVKFLDIGDIIGVEGRIMKTNTGETTVRATSFKILSKALRPLPEKYHGLKDQEEIYRRRYVDLIMNAESKSTFVKRSQIMTSFRRTLEDKNFLEVETPILTPTLGGAAAKPFETHHNALDMDFKLRIATELPLKRLIVGGMDRVFEIGRLFRNEGISIKHNPEFTTIELYQAYANVEDMMRITEELIGNASMKVNGTTEIEYQGTPISLKAPFKSIEMAELVKEVKGIDFREITSYEEATKLADEHGVKFEAHHNTVGYILNLFFEEFGEPAIVQPTFVTGYPIEVSPLAKEREEDKLFTDRFELFVDGREYANAFTELNEADEQYRRFMKQQEARDLGDDEANDVDMDYVEALSHGMPPTGGLGIGMDRLVMLLTDSRSIRDVLLFPHQRNRDGE